ncbi:hypothetical protein NSZ01_00700 [Nocardioides szechwanensis]|uniref:Uncharacterized protein n=1 Tax=Nocardioides szechwanensis TaxID=1005944 RepID=A0A1G9XIK4_9ACTN|nr:hypothetical protein [Nocardioides szechwanensis]GEP32302.1 hypothetical protein NSZ01_00700 [Nocardioides szechwanensis]SDM96550.1 hypothetical protein SAMN05192576_1383 [Nocardioides szechwanensis]
MSYAPEPVGTEPPEPPGESIAATVEALHRRVMGDLGTLLDEPDEHRGAPPTETPD